MSDTLDFLKPFLEELVLIERNDSHKISYFEKNSEEVVISFSSTPRVNDKEGHEQFIGTLSQNNKTAIFIIDLQNSYGNNLDWERIVSLINPIVNGRKVIAIGYCMGGFLATVLSKYMNVESVVSITPQFSIHPDYMPDYSFLKVWADRITDWKIKSLDGYFHDNTNYYIFCSEFRDDTDQIDMYPDMNNIYKFAFKCQNHNLPTILGDSLGELMLDCINGHPEKVSEFIESQVV